jgi:hypothetical protein
MSSTVSAWAVSDSPQNPAMKSLVKLTSASRVCAIVDCELAWNCSSDSIDQVEITGTGVSTTHCLQYPVIAALCREMQVLADIRAFSNQFEHLNFRVMGRMRGNAT